MKSKRHFRNYQLGYVTILLILISTIVGCKTGKEDDKNYTCINHTHSGYTILEHDGIIREYILYTPKLYDSNTPIPLVINFHGFGGCASDYMNSADMHLIADSDTFLLVYPQGSDLDGEPHWNPSLIGGDNKSDVDDLGFTEAMINEISDEYNVAMSRIYAVGYSNGGMMAYGLANNKSELFAAVASISGALLDCSNSISHPMPILHLHGTSDDVIPYLGGDFYNSVQDTLDCWINYNNTSATPTVNSDNSSGMNIEHFVYDQGDNMVSVEHYKFNGGGHVWFENTYQGQTTSELVWGFFSRYDINGLR